MREPIHATERGRNFHEALWPLFELRNVKRSGAILCGYFGDEERNKFLDRDEEGPFFKNRAESDAEHCNMLKDMIFCLHAFYPELFVQSKEEIEKYGYNRYYLLQATVTLHEMGELEEGDIPDDGTRDNAAKDKQEAEYFDGYQANARFPSFFVALHSNLFRGMQSVRDGLPFVGPVDVINSELDKCGAVIANFYFEKEGKNGSMNYKEASESDLRRTSIIHTDSPADAWFFHTLEAYQIYFKDEFWPITKIFLEIIQSVSLAVRGKEVEWLNDYIQSKAD